MKIKTIIASIALAALATGCTINMQAQAKTITDTAGNVCEVVLQATDPALTPICTTAVAVADAIEALVAQATTVVTADAGAAKASAKPGVTYKPSHTEVYQYLVQHGAKPAAR